MRACDGKYSEDTYYKMCLQDRHEKEYERYYQSLFELPKPKKKHKLNHHVRKMIDTNKLNKLYNEAGWWVIHDKGKHKKRCYITSSKHHKRYSNKKVRKFKDHINSGGAYKKIYDYWWEVL